MASHYFDWAATTPISEKALDTYVRCAREYRANPSSVHPEGRYAHRFLEQQRAETAALLGVQPRNIVFTGGATEGNSIVLGSLLWKRTPGRIIMSSLEHDSILQYRRLLETRGFEVITIGAPNGYVDPRELETLLTEDTQMVCIMLVSNVLGTVQPIGAISKLLRNFQGSRGRRIHLHCDAVQALGKIPFDLTALDVDSATFSAHKFQGPRGTGILYRAGDVIEPQSKGGGQEMGLRGGTEHVAAIAAMLSALGEAVESLDAHIARAMELRNLLENELAAFGHISLLSPPIGGSDRCSPFICTIGAQGIPSEVLTRVLHDRGFCVSSGSACSNNAPGKANSLLTSTGISAQSAESAIRISFSHLSGEDEIVLLARTIGNEARQLKNIMRKR